MDAFDQSAKRKPDLVEVTVRPELILAFESTENGVPTTARLKIQFVMVRESPGVGNEVFFDGTEMLRWPMV